MADPATIVQWLQKLPIPWLVSGIWGSKDVKSYGTFLDSQVDTLKDAVESRFPDKAPSDALTHVGGDRGLIQGPHESNSDFTIRLKKSWDSWSQAGTAGQLLLELYYYGFHSAALIDQNGLIYTLNESSTIPPSANQVDYVIISNAMTLTIDITSSVDTTRSIPAGNPWWTIDFDTDFSSRFIVLFSGNPLPGPFVTWAKASFNGTTTSSITWNNVFADAHYNVIVSPPTMASGTGPAVANKSSLQTFAGTTIAASSAFTGTVDVLAYQTGANPFADLHPSDLSVLRTIIGRWKPAKATCAGIYVLVQGSVWGYPVTDTWGGLPAQWGGNTVVTYSP